jgi:hypothetical protein
MHKKNDLHNHDYKGSEVNYIIHCFEYLFPLGAYWEYLLHHHPTGFQITCSVGHTICL